MSSKSAEDPSLIRLKRAFCQSSEYGVLDNWITFQYEKNFKNEAKTWEVLAKDKEDRALICALYDLRKQYFDGGKYSEAHKLSDDIEVLVRNRNMQLEEVEANTVPYIFIDFHWLPINKTLQYLDQIEWALRENSRNLAGEDQMIRLITGYGKNSNNKSSLLKITLLDAHAGRIEEDEDNEGVLHFIVRKRPSVWDYVEFYILSV